MRNFPIQDYIPVYEQQQQRQESNSVNQATPVDSDASASLNALSSPHEADRRPSSALASEVFSLKREPTSEHELPDTEVAPLELSQSSEPTISSIANAVLSLPTFTSDGFLKRHAPKSRATPSSANRKKSSAAIGKGRGRSEPAVPSTNCLAAAELNAFKQEEWKLAYVNSTVPTVHIRSDGSAIAKWPSGSIAVSVDRERDGFRVYAAHKDGQIALSFDAAGVGFINYHPSGKMMISTTSSGDGLYFSSDGLSILRQWDVDLTIKDEHLEPTDALGDEPDGSLLCKLSDGIGVRVQLAEPRTGTGEAGPMSSPSRWNPIQLSVYFATTHGIRYTFTNSVNCAPRGGDFEPQSNECECVFGKQPPPKRQETGKPPPVPHADLLHDIRAAVASLKL